MKRISALASIAFSLACLNIAGNAYATNLYVKYGTSSFCKVTVNANSDIYSDILGGTYPIGTAGFTAAGDQYVEGSLDTQSCGTTTGGNTANPAFANSTAALLAASPSTIQGASNATTLTWGMQNASQCIASATFTPSNGSTSAVTGISGWPSSFCSTVGTCNGSKSANLTGLSTTTAGAYAFTLTCVNSSNASVSSTANVNVVIQPVGNCPGPVVPSGLTLQGSVPVMIGAGDNGSNHYTGNGSNFAQTFGIKADSSGTGTPIPGQTPTAWPGVFGQTLIVTFNQNQYLALPFTPTAGNSGHFAVGGTAAQPNPSITMSACPGDFRTSPQTATATTPALGSNCSITSGSPFYWDTVPGGQSPVCHLTPGQTYFLNMIQAQLTNSTATPTSLCGASSCGAQINNSH